MSQKACATFIHVALFVSLICYPMIYYDKWFCLVKLFLSRITGNPVEHAATLQWFGRDRNGPWIQLSIK